MESKLLDLKDCSKDSFKQIYEQMLGISLEFQPGWFRPFLSRSPYLQRLVGYDHWSRAWEYPWAVLASDFNNNSLRILDVGGGGSCFAIYLSRQGHDSYESDPSMNQGMRASINKEKGLFRNVRSFIFLSTLRLAGIRRVWGEPSDNAIDTVHYYPYSATDLKFPDGYFDKVYCLSVLEHIPEDLWGKCMSEFERVLKSGGRLIITLDMGTPAADARLYLKLVRSCNLQLIGDPSYEVPITPEDKQARHPGNTYETIGLVWEKKLYG